MLRAQRLLPDLQGIMQKVRGLFVFVLVPVGDPKDGGGQPGWAMARLIPAGPGAWQNHIGGTLQGSPLGLPTPPKPSTGSLYPQITAKPLATPGLPYSVGVSVTHIL